jgi:chromosome segregation protein
MRFEELSLERYGAFTNRTLTLRAGARLHIVLGANEAGKTSALNAIGDLLFGFGRRTDYDFLHESKLLRIGARLRLADGSTLAFRRRKGEKNTILDANDKPLSDALLTPLLGAVTRDTFFSEFGLTAQSLRAGGEDLLKAGGRLAETLAASSAQLSALSRLRATLDEEADALFSPRRVASKAFYVAASRYDAADKHLRDVIVTADAMKEADKAVAAARLRCDELDKAHDAGGRELARRQRAQRTGPRLRKLDALRGDLDALSDLPGVDGETLAVWRAALDEQKRIEAQMAQFNADDAQGRAAMTELAVDEALLAAGERADALREKVGAVRKAESDLPNRHAERRVARDTLNKLAQRLGLASHELLLAQAPSDPARAAARDLIDERKNAERRLEEAQSALDDARQRLQQLEDDAAKEGHVADPSPLQLRFEAFADAPAIADRLRRETAAIALEEKRLAEAVAHLDPAAGDVDDLARRALPDIARINAARLEHAALEEEEKRAAAEMNAAHDAEAGFTHDIARLAKAGALATRDDLLAARARRDASSAALAASLDGDAAQRRKDFGKLLAAQTQIDETTDLLLSDSDRATRLQATQEQIAETRARLEQLEVAQRAREALRLAAQDSWMRLWAASGVEPVAPHHMASWRELVSDLLERRARIDDKKSAAQTLSQELEDHRAALTRLIEDIGVAPDRRLPIDALYKYAQAAIAQAQRDWTGARESAVRREAAEATIKKLDADCARHTAALDALQAVWPSVIGKIGVDAEASIAQAEAALAVWRDVPMQKQTFEEADYRISGIDRDIAEFAREVAALVNAAAPDLAGRPAREALDEITRRLATMRNARERRDALREAEKARDAARAALAVARERALEALSSAREALSVDEDAGLEARVERLERRAMLTAQIAEMRRDLMEIGDGLDEEVLRAEQKDLDADILAGEIERLEIRRRQLVADIAEAGAMRHEAIKMRDALAAGHDAQGAAFEKAEAEAELCAISEKWLTRAAAARLAARAIEGHRAAVQDPLIARASTLFSLATDGAFAGLGAQYDEGDAPVLVGRRPDANTVHIEQMSEGARDQLFLALRLALLELRAAEPLPFVGDDLLSSFDERRVACALGLLAEFGVRRQAILFTHHRHVANIARETLAEAVDVISL